MAKEITAQVKIARILCEFMDDEWRLGKDLYLGKATEILEATGHNALVKALQMARDCIDPAQVAPFTMSTIDAALAKAGAQ